MKIKREVPLELSPLDAEMGNMFEMFFRIMTNYVEKMRTGEVPVDMESWILTKRILQMGFEIPDGVLPDSPVELTEPISLGGGNLERIS